MNRKMRPCDCNLRGDVGYCGCAPNPPRTPVSKHEVTTKLAYGPPLPPWRVCDCDDGDNERIGARHCLCPSGTSYKDLDLGAEQERLRQKFLNSRRAAALGAVKTLLEFIGEDASRPGIKDTPERVLKAWEQSWGAGYREAPPALTVFPEDRGVVDYTRPVLVKGITFYSTCEHHMAPFFGTADVCYIPDPDRGVLGISKLARVVEHFARRLQVQERLTGEVANHLAIHVSPHVAVRMSATHMCMVSRGVMQPNAVTVTSSLKGRFHDDAQTSAGFFDSLRA